MEGFKDSQKISCLYAACYKDKPQILRSLLEAASLRDDLNMAEIASAPLGYACMEGHTECVEALLEAGADPVLVYPADSNAPHPLLIATTEGHLSIVQMLLKKNANPNYEDRQGTTPFACAALSKVNTEAIIMELVKAGADIFRPNVFGVQPVVEVMKSKNREAKLAMAKVLQDREA